MAVSPPQLHMPGTFSALPPKLDTDTRPNPQVFQTPKTPASSASGPYAFGNVCTTSQPGRRKRPRPDSSDREASRRQGGYFATPCSASANGWSNVAADPSISRSVDLASPAPFVNSTYALAGGLDTPLATGASSYERTGDFSDTHFRRRWSVTSDRQGDISRDGLSTPGPLARERNGKSRLQSADGSAGSWSKLVLDLVGGVAGKMWEFCRASAFRGFYAGGGQGYDIVRTHQDQLGTSSMWGDMGDAGVFVGESTPVPGQFPGSAQNEFALQDDTPPRPSKRVHTDSGAEWVMVDRAAGEQPLASTPHLSTRKAPTFNPFKSSIPRPVSRAGSRRSLLPVSRRQSAVSHAGSPALQSGRPASFASARSPVITPGKPASPPSADAQRYAARIRHQELETDVSMRRLNRQLQTMIREGKAALGTRPEIGGDELMDDGSAGKYFGH